MKLVLVFNDGRKETFDGVVSCMVIEEQITTEEQHEADELKTASKEVLTSAELQAATEEHHEAEELQAVTEEHHEAEELQAATEEHHEAEVPQAPTEGIPFEVNLLEIDWSIFEKPMSDPNNEAVRKKILKAYDEVAKHPEKYASRFLTLMPKKTWKDKESKTVAQLEAYANDFGGQVADWVEQTLEWAQRLSNGESWEAICHDKDTANWTRMVYWKEGKFRSVGGSRNSDYGIRATDFLSFIFRSDPGVFCTVPLVVLKKS